MVELAFKARYLTRESESLLVGSEEWSMDISLQCSLRFPVFFDRCVMLKLPLVWNRKEHGKCLV